MSSHDNAPANANATEHEDPMDRLVHSIPYVIPAAGALMIFLLAFIAVTMA